MVCGGSSVGVVYKDGIMIAADTLGSYGKMARYKNIERIAKVNDQVCLASWGEYSDFTHVVKQLQNMHKRDLIADDGQRFTTQDYVNYLGTNFSCFSV